MIAPPQNSDAEWAVVGAMLTREKIIAEVVGAQLAVEDFFNPDARLIYETAVESFYAGEKVDPVLIGDRLRAPLARQWECQEAEVPQRLYAKAAPHGHSDGTLDHAKLIRRHADNRRLLTLMEAAQREISDGRKTPEEVGDMLATEAAQIIAGGRKRADILSFADVGKEYLRYLKRLKLAREQGIELAVYTGLKFVDNWTKGIAPGELVLIAGDPGVGKSALTWEMVQGFARRQMTKPADRRLATLVLSMEMGLEGSGGRLATGMTRIEGDKLREGVVTNDELAFIVDRWKNVRDLPLYWNFAPNFRMSQMRALIVEGIRRHNVTHVLIDHFRMFDPDRRINNPNQEDEAKVRFLKEDIARDLNVAVLCLAHTVKMRRDSGLGDGRPQLADLRGSGQVNAHADIIAFMYRPYMYATEEEKLNGDVEITAAELIFRKSRSGSLGTSHFYFDPATMTTRDQW